MDLYTNGGNIRLEICRRFISLTMYNLHIFYFAPLMFSRSSHFLISGLHAENTKIKDQPYWVVLLNLCQLFSSMHDYCFLPCMWPQVIDLFPSKQAGIVGMAVSFFIGGVSHGRKGGILLDLCQLFPSMHDYCFLLCMWPQVIDLSPLKQAGIVGMAISFSIAWGIAWP